MAETEGLALALDVTVGDASGDEGDTAFAERVLARGIELLRADLPPGARGVYLSLVLTGDDEIAALNREFRGVDAPTDVLSFPAYDDPSGAAPDPDGPPLPLGDIVVSLPRTVEQAARYGHSREREFGFLLVHGLLHLLGYDHETPAKAATMEARQEDVLASLGLPRDAGA